MVEKEERVIELVLNYINNGLEEEVQISREDIKLVWFCKTLQNYKALVADIKPGGNFFEITYSGNKKETYIDIYTKTDNVVVEDTE